MDYNIYIHTVSQGGNESPTTPWSLRGIGEQTNGDGNENISGGGFSPSTAIKRGAAFLSNPDSLIGTALSTPIGKIGIAAVVIKAAIDITKKTINTYQSFYAPNTGDYRFQTQYNNFNRTLDAVKQPFSTGISILQGMLEEKRKDSISEQKRLLTGGTILNSSSGRYL